MVVGDSLTYGYGVQEEKTYPRLIESSLSKYYRVEVLNLGITNYQSEDILKLIKKYTPILQPNLIIYGVCLNDFLPSGVGEYQNNMAYSVPVPITVKRILLEKTRLGRMVSDAYDIFLMKIGLRNDFYTDILKNFKDYQTRFAQDVKGMNMFVLNRGLPPIVAMVLDQCPELHSKGYQIAMAAEQHLTNAGFTVIPIDPFYRNYNKQQMMVSLWEGHPNEEAHKIFADFLVAYLLKRGGLKKYQIQG
jgi:hypothetical protein